MSTVLAVPSTRPRAWKRLRTFFGKHQPALPSRPVLLYAAVTLLTCLWVLSLPLFPSQDAPLHLYYVAIFKQLLLHQHTAYTAVYQVRHYLPPYAAYYYTLIALSHFVRLETADKLFAAANIAFFATSGFLFLRTLYPASRWPPLLLLPLLLNWPLLMGFANFSFASSFALLAMAAWSLARRSPGRGYTLVFLALVVLMIVTHPLPWAFALGFAALELFIRFWHHRAGRILALPGTLRRDLVTLALAALSYLYLVPFRSQTQIITRLVFDHRHLAWRPIPSPAHLQRLHAQAFCLIHTQGIVLFLGTGLPRLFRLGLGLLFWGSLLLATAAALSRFRHSRHRASPGIPASFPGILLLYTVLVALGLIVVPDSGAGGYFIATRMQLLTFVCAIAAAVPAFERRPRLAHTAAALAVLLGLLNLCLALRYINPVARTILTLQAVPLPHDPSAARPSSLPAGGPGLLMRPVGVAFPAHLNFDPYNWAPVHYFRWHHLLLFNTAWLGDKLIPIQPRPRALTALDATFFNQAPQFGDRLLLDTPVAAHTLSRVSFLLLQKDAIKHYQSPFAEIGGSLSPGPFADNWTCTDRPSGHWYLCQPL